jgi:hypothetical protein
VRVRPARSAPGDQAEPASGLAPALDLGAAAGRPYALLAAPVVAVLLVAWGATVSLDRAGVIVRALAVSGLFAGSCVLAVTPGLALVCVASRRRQIGPATGLGLLFAGAGTAAMAGFWAWFASPQLGRAFSAVLLVTSVAAIGVFGRRGDLRRLELSRPLALALAVGLVFTGLAFVQGRIGLDPLRDLDGRYWETFDNGLPLLFAVRVAAHLPLSGYLYREWLSSDRPPLQTGFALLQWPLWGGGRLVGYQLLATGLQISWLPALWVLLRVRGVPAGRVCVAVLATAATGAVFVNTVYVWPKMLAAGLVLAALAILVSRDDGDRWAGAGILAAVLAALGMLAHGGTAFALIALLPFGWLLRRRVTVRSVVACSAAALGLYLPWVMYQRFVAPPGDRLLKWQLAGVIPIDSRGALQTIVQQYRSLSVRQLLANKWENLAALVADPVRWHTQASDPGWARGFLGLARVAQLYDLLPAAGPLLLGAAALLIPSARRALAPARPLAVFTGLTLAAWVVLLWGGQVVPAIIHEGPYAVVILVTGLCALAVTALPRLLAGAILASSVAWFLVCWVPGLGFRQASARIVPPGPVDQAMLLVCAGGLVAVAVICARYAYPRRLRPEGLVERNQVMLQGEDRRLGAVGEPELGEDAGHVALDGFLGDRKRPGDLPV